MIWMRVHLVYIHIIDERISDAYTVDNQCFVNILCIDRRCRNRESIIIEIDKDVKPKKIMPFSLELTRRINCSRWMDRSMEDMYDVVVEEASYQSMTNTNSIRVNANLECLCVNTITYSIMYESCPCRLINHVQLRSSAIDIVNQCHFHTILENSSRSKSNADFASDLLFRSVSR